MNAGKIAFFVVAVLVSVPMSGCAAVTAASAGGSSAPAGGGAVAVSSPVSYKPAEIPESAHSYGGRSTARIAPHLVHGR